MWLLDTDLRRAQPAAATAVLPDGGGNGRMAKVARNLNAEIDPESLKVLNIS
jgi:hypothetical protein